jgi:hypothetical protein
MNFNGAAFPQRVRAYGCARESSRKAKTIATARQPGGTVRSTSNVAQ